MIKKRTRQSTQRDVNFAPIVVQIPDVYLTGKGNDSRWCKALSGSLMQFYFLLLVCTYSISRGLFYKYFNGRQDTTIVAHLQRTEQCTPLDTYGDISPLPPDTPFEAVHSIFNCNSQESSSSVTPYTSRCEWFYPRIFFDETCGTGRDYRNQVQFMQALQRNRSLWSHMPSIFLHTVSLNPDMEWQWSFRKEPFQILNLTMIHVHKTGGSSMVHAYRALNHRFPRVGDDGISSNAYLVYKPKFTNTAALSSSLRSSSVSYDLLDHAVKYPSSWRTNDHILFAMVRDPVQRFISSLGQAMGATGSKHNGPIAKQLISTCFSNRTNSTSTRSVRQKVLKCAIQYVQRYGYWFEIHFTPMVLEITFITGMERSTPVAVFPFEALPAVLYELGADPFKKVKDGSKAGVRPDILLTKMTVEDFEDEMLVDVCDLYRIDVVFMKHLGFPTRCDTYLQNDFK